MTLPTLSEVSREQKERHRIDMYVNIMEQSEVLWERVKKDNQVLFL